MKKLILIGVILISITSCVTQKKCSERFPCIKSSDTTTSKIVTIERHDTIFKFQADSSALQALIECRGQIPYLKNIIAYTSGKTVKIPIIRIRHDTLFVDCKIDSSQVAVSYFEKHTTEFTKIKNQAVQIEYRKTKFDGFTFWWFFISAGLLFIYLVVKYGIPLIRKAILKV